MGGISAATVPDALTKGFGASSWAVLLVGPLPPPSGGMANQTRQLARLLADEGCSVTVVQVNAAYRPPWIGRVRGVRALFRLVPYVWRLWRAARRADLIHVMANSGWAWHLCAMPAIWIARLRRKPVIVNYRGGEAERFLLGQAKWILPTLRRASVVVVPSGFLEAIFSRFGIASEIVPNVVDLERFVPGESHVGPPHLIVTRNLEDIYDLPTALRAFARVRERFPGARLTVAGSGPLRDDLERFAAVLGIAQDVTFTGRVENDRIPELYRAADLLLNPSRIDNMPISLLEAMASGVPIVSTNVGGIPYLVRDGETALLVAPGDALSMAAAAVRVLEDPVIGRRLRAAGLDAAQAYTWSRVRGKLFAVYAREIGAALPKECLT
jgi:glycosyltransferase involved in cell wall biosynthesis